MTTREEIHALVDQLADDQLATAFERLEALTIPFDDEPMTDEDLTALERSRGAIARNELIPHDEVRRRLGRPARSS